MRLIEESSEFSFLDGVSVGVKKRSCDITAT